MATVPEILAQPRPESIWTAPWPELLPGEEHFPSPTSWQRQCIYEIMVDRFSDGNEDGRQLLPRDRFPVRPNSFHWDQWARSGWSRFQGGTIRGATSKLDYLANLGITAVWLTPVWKQRAEADEYHGYAIQDFLDVDPRFGTRRDLVDFVDQAHQRGIWVIVDIVINHCGENWLYDIGSDKAPRYEGRPDYRPKGQYPFGVWLDGNGQPMAPGARPVGPDDGVYPRELQDPAAFTRAGFQMDFGEGDPDSVFRQDWFARDLSLPSQSGAGGHTVLQTLIRTYSYVVKLYGVDGFRIDTLKHVRIEDARRFCGAIREFGESIGKTNFLLVGEVAGGRTIEQTYLDVLGRDLSAVLQIGAERATLRDLATGHGKQDSVADFFRSATAWEEKNPVATHRRFGSSFVTTIDDHDNLWINPKLRFGANPPPGREPDPRQTTLGAALILFLLGIPCLYYGDEQAMTGPETRERQWLEGHDWREGRRSDEYLREAMFGPEHPRRSGRAGRPEQGVDVSDPSLFDPDLPGFGPAGTTGMHLFDENSPSYRKAQHLLAVRAAQPALQSGRQYLRQLRTAPTVFRDPQPGDVLPWSRILADREVLCVMNPSLDETRDAEVLVDGFINPDGAVFTVLGNTALFDGAQHHPVDEKLVASTDANGSRYLRLSALPPASVLALGN
jgi:glycosidase